jgi:hypothetical protein
LPLLEGIVSRTVVDKLDEMGVLLALYLLTDGDIHDSVPNYQLCVETGRPQSEVDEAMEALVKQGLAETVFITEGATWLGVTARGAYVVSELSHPSYPGGDVSSPGDQLAPWTRSRMALRSTGPKLRPAAGPVSG